MPHYVAETECDYWGAGPLDRGNAGHAKDGQGTSGQSAKMQAMQRHLSSTILGKLLSVRLWTGTHDVHKATPA